MIWLSVVSAPWSELDENKRRISVLDIRDRLNVTRGLENEQAKRAVVVKLFSG